jgi:hypothetical protein
MKHEVDWALIKVHEERLKVDNAMTATSSTSVKAGSKSASTGTANQQPVLTKIMPLAKLSGLQVHCRGRSSGFKKGRISQAMALVKMHGRQSFSTSWCVEGGIGVPGDSGAWVYDPISGGLCGHVLAWSERSKTAYIAPMEVLFEDIRARLGAQCVELPVPSAVSMRGGAGAGPEKDEKGTVVETGTAACKGDGGDDIAEKLSRLKIEKETTMRTLVMAGPVS